MMLADVVLDPQKKQHPGLETAYRWQTVSDVLDLPAEAYDCWQFYVTGNTQTTYRSIC